MALKAIIDPARRRLQSAAQKQAPAGTDQQGVRKAITLIQARPMKKAVPGQPAVKPPVTPPADQPNVYNANPNANLATVAQQMQAEREKRNFGTLADITSKQYLPALEKAQTSVANVNTAQVSRILGEEQPLPATMDEQSAELSTIAKQLQTARETGDLGTANKLAQRYNALVGSLAGTASQAQPGGQPGAEMPTNAAPTAAPLQKGTVAQTAAGAPVPNEPTAGTPQADPETPPAGTPATFDAGTAWAGRLKNPGLKIKGPGGQWLDDPTGAQKIQSLVDYDNQFLAGLPPEAQGWASQQMASEQKTFEAALAQYPDQWDKIFRDHQTRTNEIMSKWDSVGKWETQLQDIMNQAPPETKVKIEELMKQGNNEALNAAIADLKAGKDPVANIDKYLEKFGQKAEFDLGQPGFELPDYQLDEYKKADGIEIAGADNVDLTTDKSRIDAALQQSSMSDEGKQALKLQLETIQKRLQEGGGGFSDDELKNMASPLLQQLRDEEQAAISALQHDRAAAGYTGDDMNTAVAAERRKFAGMREEVVMNLLKENMGYKQQGTTSAIEQLGGISEAERSAGLTEKDLALKGATTTTTLTSEEKKAQAQANLAQKALSQEGELAVWGTRVDENLAEYGFKLDQYKSDKGFDLERYKTDLDERVAQGDLDVKEAQLAYTKVKDSIDAAQKETEMYDRRNETIASLQQRVAEGDQDADYRIQALQVQQELTGLGLKSEWTSKIASLIYGVRAQGLQLNQDWKMFLEQMAATKEAQDSNGFMEFVGSVVGAGVGSLAGGVGGAAGAAAGKKLFGGTP